MNMDRTNDVLSRWNVQTEKSFHFVGRHIGDRPWTVLIIFCVIYAVLTSGLSVAKRNTDILDLWTERDSRLHAENAFIDDNFITFNDRTVSIIAYDKADRGSSVLTEAHLADMTELMTELQSVRIVRGGLNYTLDHVCSRVIAEVSGQVLALPCTRFVPIDCFSEGGFDFNPQGASTFLFANYTLLPPTIQALIPEAAAAPFIPYDIRPSFVGMDPEMIKSSVSGSCFTYLVVSKPPRSLLFGGSLSTDTEFEASSLNANVQLSSSSRLASRLCDCLTTGVEQSILDDVLVTGATTCQCENPTQEQEDESLEILLAFEQAVLDFMSERADSFSTLRFTFFAERSKDDLTDLAGSTDVALIIIGYVVMILFVSISAFNPSSRVTSRVGAAIVGVFIVIFALLASLGFASFIGLEFSPEITQVLPFLAVALGVDDMFVLLYTFKHHARPNSAPSTQTAECMRMAGTSITLTSLCNLVAFSVASTIPLPNASTFAGIAAIVVVFNYFAVVFGFLAFLSLDAKRVQAGRTDVLCCSADPKFVPSEQMESQTKLSDVIVGGYAKALSCWPVKLVIMGGALAFLIVTAVKIPEVKVGLPLQEIVPQDSEEAEFLSALEDFFYISNNDLYFGINKDGVITEVDYTNDWNDIIALEVELQALASVDDSVPITARSWVDNLDRWIRATNGTFTGTDSNGTSFTRMDAFDIVGDTAWSSDEVFYEALATFFSDPSNQAAVDPNNIQYGSDGRIVASRVPFFQVDTITTQDRVDFIIDSRAVTDAQDVAAVPGGFSYTLYEQYLRVRSYLGDLVLWSALGVGLVSLLLLVQPLGTLLMLIVLAAAVVEIYGFLYFAGLQVNGVTVLNLVTAVAVSVEFVGHVTRAFMTSRCEEDMPGSWRVFSKPWFAWMNKRMVEALKETAQPVLYGGLSTFLGVVPMAFASFPYFQLYFFRMYLIIILVGLFNGLVLLPVVLSIFGPPPLKRWETLESASVHEKSTSLASSSHVEGVEITSVH